MSEYYYDEVHGIAYKIDPVLASKIGSANESSPNAILVYTDIKVTNVRKEKVRRTLSEMFQSDQHDLESAKKIFYQRTISKIVKGAQKISEKEYQKINSKFEA